jgi:hypothetical protein
MSLSADSPEYPLGLDLGPVALGSWVIAEGFCLHRDYLTLWYSITGAPDPWEPAALHLNAFYYADVPPERLDYHGAVGLSGDGCRVSGDLEYCLPPAEATVAWFDIFQDDFDVDMHVGRDGIPDDDYLRARVGRLTIDLARRTASAEVFARWMTCP